MKPVLAMLAAAAVFILALLPAHAAEPLAVTQVAPGVYVHSGSVELFTPVNRGDISNCGFIVGDDAIAVIDTGGSRRIGEGLLAAIRAVTDKPVRYVINTHMHPDHVFGNAAFAAEGVEFIGHAKLDRALAAREAQYLSANKPLLGDAFDGVEIVRPTRPVDGSAEIDLGGRILKLEAWPTAHTDNDLTVYDETTGTMFMGDLLFARHIPALDGSIKGWLALMDELRDRKLDRVVPGHGPASMDWPQAVEAQQRYLETIAETVRADIAAGKSLSHATSHAGEAERDKWELFDAFNARNVTAAFAELEWE